MVLDVWSDVACPWCYVGKRRLDLALERWEGEPVEVVWHSFELDPEAPAERLETVAEHIAAKYGSSPVQTAARLEQLRATAAADGVDLRFDLQRSGSTFDAHRLIHLAAETGRADAMKERLLKAYHTDGDLLSDHGTLKRLAGEVGLPEDAVAEMLSGDRFTDAVRTDEATAAHIGVRGVPFFVVNRKVAAAGAQDPDALLELLQSAA